MNPIAIGGDGRSGTTMLAQMLDAHPGILIGPEIHLRHVDDISSDYWCKRLSRVGFSVEQLKQMIAEWSHPVTRFPDRCYFLQSVLMDKMRERGKKHWGFKLMRDIGILNFYDKVWPEARYIHIIRDGRDVASSNFAFNWGYSDIEGAAAGWAGNIMKARKNAVEIPDRYLEVRYEDIVNDTLGSMKDILKFLKIDFHPDVLTPYREGRKQPFFETPVGHPSYKQLLKGIDQQHIGKYKKNLTADQIRAFEKVAGYMLEDLDYE